MARERQKQLELGRRQVDALLIESDGLLSYIDDERTDGPTRAGLPRGTPRNGMNTRYQLGDFKGLDNVVISPAIETAQAIVQTAIRGHDEHGNGILAATQ